MPSPLGEPAEFKQPSSTNVVLVILENKDADAAHDEQYPFLWRLAKEGAYLSRYYALAHPSQPNYVALVSGSFEGVRGDSVRRLHRAHLGQKLDGSWMTYAEGYPRGTCDTREEIKETAYVRKHVPFMSFADIQDDLDGICRRHISDIADFTKAARDHDLPKFSLVIPNLNNDAHDGSLAVADAWLNKQLGPFLDDPEFRRDVVLIVTFDEDGTRAPYLSHRKDNRVYAALWGRSVLPGDIAIAYNHYDLLRTIERILAVQPMAEHDRDARAIGGIWR